MKIDTTHPSSEPSATGTRMTIPESDSDFNQWLQSMLSVARLPEGLPIEFRRKVTTKCPYKINLESDC